MSSNDVNEQLLWEQIALKKQSISTLKSSINDNRKEVSSKKKLVNSLLSEIETARIENTPLIDEDDKWTQISTLKSEINTLITSIKNTREIIKDKENTVEDNIDLLQDNALEGVELPPPLEKILSVSRLQVNDNTTIAGNVKINNNLNVSGNIYFDNSANLSDLTVTNNTNLNKLVVDNSTNLTDLNVINKSILKDISGSNLDISNNFKVNNKFNLADRFILDNSNNIIVKTNIIPDLSNVYTLGSLEKPFMDLFLGPSSLYINGTKVISADQAEEMKIETTINQNLTIQTSGTGVFKLQSNADMNLNTVGVNSDINFDTTGAIKINSPLGLVFTANNYIKYNNQQLILKGDILIDGSLNITGNQTIINTETVTIKDNIIELNSNQINNPPSTLESGIKVNRGVQDEYKFIFKEDTKSFNIGISGNLQPVATRKESNLMIDKGILYWDISNVRLDTFDNVKFNNGNLDLVNGSKLLISGVDVLSNINTSLNGKLNLTGGTLTGNGGLFSLASTDHGYIQFFPTGVSNGRKAYVGFPDAGIETFTIENQYAGESVDIKPAIKENGVLLSDKYELKGVGGGTTKADVMYSNIFSWIGNNHYQIDLPISSQGFAYTHWIVKVLYTGIANNGSARHHIENTYNLREYDVSLNLNLLESSRFAGSGQILARFINGANVNTGTMRFTINPSDGFEQNTTNRVYIYIYSSGTTAGTIGTPVVQDLGVNISLTENSGDGNWFKSHRGNMELRKGVPVLDMITSNGTNGYRLLSNVSDTDDFGFRIDKIGSTSITNMFVLKSDGKCGIGTDNPLARLDIRGNIRLGSTSTLNLDTRTSFVSSLLGHKYEYTSNNTLNNYGGSANTYYRPCGIMMGYFDSFQVSTNDSHRTGIGFLTGDYTENQKPQDQLKMYIRNDGNVGIGTTDPLNKLHVEGTVNGEHGIRIRNLSSGSNAYNIFRLASDHENGGLVVFINSTTRTADGGINNATIRNDNGHLTLGVNMHLQNGNVGIGTAPTRNLHISGSGSVYTRTTTTTGSGNSFLIGQDGARVALWTNYNRLTDDGWTERLTIKNETGNVGIGTNNPIYPLHINRTTQAPSSYEYFFVRPAGPNTGYYTAQPSYTSFFAGHVRIQGEIHMHSDYRIKENIQDISDNECLLKIRNIKPKKYEYIDKLDKGSHTVYGFIAQEVGEILPDAIDKVKEIIPDYFKLVNIINVDLSYIDISIDVSMNKYDLSINDTIKIIVNLNDNEIKEYILPVLEIINNTNNINIKIKNPTNTVNINSIFLFGKLVEDFHLLKKNAIWTVLTSAVQEIDRIQQNHQNEINTLKEENSNLKSRLEQIEALLGISS